MQTSNVRVLCVEHHIEYVEALKDMPETSGYEGVSATAGSPGALMLAEQSVQSVLLEYDPAMQLAPLCGRK